MLQLVYLISYGHKLSWLIMSKMWPLDMISDDMTPFYPHEGGNSWNASLIVRHHNGFATWKELHDLISSSGGHGCVILVHFRLSPSRASASTLFQAPLRYVWPPLWFSAIDRRILVKLIHMGSTPLSSHRIWMEWQATTNCSVVGSDGAGK